MSATRTLSPHFGQAIRCVVTSRPRPSFRGSTGGPCPPPTRRRPGQHRGAVRSKRSPKRATCHSREAARTTATSPTASRLSVEAENWARTTGRVPGHRCSPWTWYHHRRWRQRGPPDACASAGRQHRGCRVATSMFLDQAAHRRLGNKLHDLFLVAEPARAEPPALAGVDHDPAAAPGLIKRRGGSRSRREVDPG